MTSSVVVASSSPFLGRQEGFGGALCHGPCGWARCACGKTTGQVDEANFAIHSRRVGILMLASVRPSRCTNLGSLR